MDDINRNTVKRSNTGAVIAESARTGRSECGTDTVEQRHAANKENDYLRNCHRKIDEIEHLCCGSYLGNDLADCRTGALCTHQVHVGAARHGDDCQKEYEYAHAADPVGQ